ncbi:uncharacterized protein SCHCODRAFT_02613632 [Schizophyllum commune H4-8]|nr:uncharacterized protein SCHCODRAFT_02613632 [Schizophyllum commune H4-8]KAI5898951.1 hypothetical protein SCHCODRAFT_02613632 [Schizophyllum commune H4-8]
MHLSLSLCQLELIFLQYRISLVQPLGDLQLQSELMLRDLRKLHSLLLKAYSPDLWRAYRRIAAEVDLHANKVRIVAMVCSNIFDDLGKDLTTHQLQIGQSNFRCLLEDLHRIPEIASITSALDALRQTMRTHLVYPWGLDEFVYGTLIPFVQRHDLPVGFPRAEALLQGIPLLAAIDDHVHATVRIAQAWMPIWRGLCEGFSPKAVLRIHQLPPDVRKRVIEPVAAIIEITARCRYDMDTISLMIAFCNTDGTGRLSMDDMDDPTYLP